MYVYAVVVVSNALQPDIIVPIPNILRWFHFTELLCSSAFFVGSSAHTL